MSCCLAGDVLQLLVPVRRADLLPGPGAAPEGLRGRDPTHVHTQGASFATFGVLCLKIFNHLNFMTKKNTKTIN